MNKRKRPESYKEFVELLAQLIRDDEPESKEELNERLKDIGYEPNQLASEMRRKVDQAIKQSPLNWRNSARLQIDNERQKIVEEKEKPKRSRAENLAVIASIQNKLGSNVVMHFRKLDLSKLSDEELESMLHDFERLDSKNKKQDE